MSIGGEILLWWLITGFLIWLGFARKDKFASDQPYGGMLRFWLLPVWLLIAPIELFFRRKKLRWLRKYWFLIAIKRAINYSLSRHK